MPCRKDLNNSCLHKIEEESVFSCTFLLAFPIINVRVVVSFARTLTFEMKLAQTLEQFNADHVTFCDPVHNTVIQSGLFSRFLYSSPHFSLSGIFLLVPLQQLRFSDKQYRGRNVQPPSHLAAAAAAAVGSENEWGGGGRGENSHDVTGASVALPVGSGSSSTQGKHRYSFSPSLNQQVVSQIVQLEAALLQKYRGVTHWDPKISKRCGGRCGGGDIQGCSSGGGDGKGGKRAVTTLSDQLTHGCIRMTPMSTEHGCGGSSSSGMQSHHALSASSPALSSSASWTAHREKKEDRERMMAAATPVTAAAAADSLLARPCVAIPASGVASVVSAYTFPSLDGNGLAVPQHVILKLTGIWETATEYGVTFKFLSF